MNTRFIGLLLGLLIFNAVALSEETPDAKQLLKQMTSLAKGTELELIGPQERPVKLVEKAIFRYSDQPRRLLDATVWTWLCEGRPIAFQKIEAMEGNGNPSWQYCLSSVADGRLAAKWIGGRKYESAEAGIAFREVPGASAVLMRTVERRRQLRELARAFQARVDLNEGGSDSQEMRLLTTPMFEYEQEGAALPGAVFGYSTNGTNPDLLIVFEARPVKDKVLWHFVPARMTTGGIAITYQDKAIWESPFVPPGRNAFDTWTYFQVSREVPGTKP